MRILSVVVPGLVAILLLLPASGRAQQPQEEAPSTRLTLERALIEQGGLLLRPGQLDVEPSVEYTFFSTRRIDVSGFSILPTLIIGVLQTEEVERNLLDTALTMRLGLFRDLQIDARRVHVGHAARAEILEPLADESCALARIFEVVPH